MNIEFECPHCSRLLAIDEKWKSQEVECPNCNNFFTPGRVMAKNAEVERAKKKDEDVAQTFKRVATRQPEISMANVWEAFAFPLRQERGIAKMAIGGLLSMIPILWFWPHGYLLRFLRGTITGKSKKMPEWANWGELFGQGFFCGLIVFVYLFLPFFLVCLFGFLFPSSAGVLWAIWLVAVFLFPMVFCEYAYKYNIASAFNVKVIIKIVITVAKDYFIQWLIVIGPLFLAGCLSLLYIGIFSSLAFFGMLFLVGHQILLFYLCLVAVKLFGGIYPVDTSEDNLILE